jgi:hypothetical protein
MEPLLFQPNEDERRLMPCFSANDVPRYPFRVYDLEETGGMYEDTIFPLAEADGDMEDIFSIDPGDAERILNQHLRQTRYSNSERTLTSWTSSFLFAIQGGLYKQHKNITMTALTYWISFSSSLTQQISVWNFRQRY